MFNFVYDGTPVEDQEISEGVFFKIEDDIMTVYEDGMLVDNATLPIGHKVSIVTSDSDNAKIVIEAKMDDEKGREILLGMGLTDEQIDTFVANNAEGYDAFVKLLMNARHEVSDNQIKEALKAATGMDDAQVNQLAANNKKDFHAFGRMINKGQKLAQQQAEVPPTDPAMADPNGAAPVEDPNATVDPNATQPAEIPTDQPTEVPEDQPAEQPAEAPAEVPVETPAPEQPQEANAAAPVEAPAEPAPAAEVPQQEAQPQEVPVEAPPAQEVPQEPVQPAEVPVPAEAQPQEVPPAPEQQAQAAPAEPAPEAPEDTPDTDENTELSPEEKEEGVNTTVNGGTPVMESPIFGVNGINEDNPYRQYNGDTLVKDLLDSTKDKISGGNEPFDMELDQKIAEIEHKNGNPKVAEEYGSAATIGPMLPQLGGNEFNEEDRAGQDTIPKKHFHETIESFMEDIDMEYTPEVEESVKDMADKIKTGVAIAATTRKLALDIAILNAKIYVAKKYNKNKLKGINLERKMLRMQKQLNDIKNASSTAEKQAIIALQKEANKKAKADAERRAAAKAEKTDIAEESARGLKIYPYKATLQERGCMGKLPDGSVQLFDTEGEYSAAYKEMRKEMEENNAKESVTERTKLDELKAHYETAERRYNEEGDIRFKNQMRGFKALIEKEEALLESKENALSEPVDTGIATMESTDLGDGLYPEETTEESTKDEEATTGVEAFWKRERKKQMAPVVMESVQEETVVTESAEQITEEPVVESVSETEYFTSLYNEVMGNESL